MRRRRRRNPVSPQVAGLAILGAAAAAVGLVIYMSKKPSVPATTSTPTSGPPYQVVQLSPGAAQALQQNLPSGG